MNPAEPGKFLGGGALNSDVTGNCLILSSIIKIGWMKIRFYSMKIQITFIFAIFKKLACKLIAEFLLNSYALSENCCKYFLCKQKNKGTTSKAPFHRKINRDILVILPLKSMTETREIPNNCVEQTNLWSWSLSLLLKSAGNLRPCFKGLCTLSNTSWPLVTPACTNRVLAI